MKIDKEMMWNILLVVSVILIINGMSHSGDTDKKTAEVANSQATAGALGAIGFVMKKTVWPAAVIATIGGLIYLIPNFFGNIVDLVNPQPSIPSWVWIAGFLILALLIFRKGK